MMKKKSRPARLPDGSEQLPRLALGTWQLGEQERWHPGRPPCNEADAAALLQTAADNEIRVIDTAPVYGNGRAETLCGTALRALPGNNFFIISKCGLTHTGGGRPVIDLSSDALRRSVDRSLERLGIPALDCLMLHWPDPRTPLTETVGALQTLLDEGLIRSAGACNFRPRQLHALLQRFPGLAAVQYMYNPAVRGVEEEILPMTVEQEILFLGYSPLCQGLFTRQRTPVLDTADSPRRGCLLLTDLNRFSSFDTALNNWEADPELPSDPACTAIQWQLQKQSGLIISGTADPKRLQQSCNLAAANPDPEPIRRAVDSLPDSPLRRRISFFY